MSEPEKLGAFPFVIGGLSFVPLLGLLFGGISIIHGLTTRKIGGKKLALIGLGGILFTVALYSSLFYFGFVKRGGVYDDLRAKMTESTLASLVQSIEFYKTENGHYPESLEELKKSQPNTAFIFIQDTSDVELGGKQRLFYYEPVGTDHYYLRSVGPDGMPFTKDDIVPKISVKPGSAVGLLIKKADTGGS